MTTERTNEHAELRRKIAEALGWGVRKSRGLDGRDRYALHTPDGANSGYRYMREDAAWHDKMIPDWPGDVGTALALCLEIARDRGWTLCTQPVRIGIVCWFVDPDTDQVFPPYHTSQFPGVYADELAEALARLALVALEDRR